jgi:hypothetical protein
MLAKALFRQARVAARPMAVAARQMVALGQRGFAANTAQIEKSI